MGRMTYSFMNDVFFGKIKSLVVGAIERAKLEDDDLHISYESLVDDLDVGDSFTTQLIEVLVKELADRHRRVDAADKRLISKRTVLGLQDMARSAPYHQRPFNARTRNRAARGNEESNFLMPFPDDHTRYDSVDDDEVDDVVENGGAVDGTRIDSHHMYDVYRPSFVPHGRRQAQFLPTPWTTENPEASRSTLDLAIASQSIPFSRQLPYGFGRRPASSRENANATSLTRQPSIRRPVRSRATDFNDFSSRRRSVQRSNTLHSPELPAPYMADDSLFLARRSPFREEPVIPAPPDNMYDSSGSEPSRVRSTLFEPPSPESSRTVQMDTSDVTENPWREPLPPPSSLISLSRNLRGESQGFPRLRRGGLRPPESLLGASSSSESLPFARTASTLADLPRALSSFEREFGELLTDDGVASTSESGPSQRRHEPTSLPTPRSISPTPMVLHVGTSQVSTSRSTSPPLFTQPTVNETEN